MVRQAIVEAFLARPTLVPPSTAPAETDDSVREAIVTGGGLIAEADGDLAGALLIAREADVVTLRRVATRPRYRHRGVASAMAGEAERVAAAAGARVLALSARVELPDAIAFWVHRDYVPVGRRGHLLDLAKPVPVTVDLPDVDATRNLGGRLAGVLRAGDLVVLTGDLGAGKTTLTQGLGAALRVRGEITSPTFVIARVHPSLVGGPDLVHVDAYRIGGALEVDDLDLDTSIEDSVTVVEWGEGKVEGLAEDRLQVRLDRPDDLHAGPSGELRRATVSARGTRWLDDVDTLAMAISRVGAV